MDPVDLLAALVIALGMVGILVPLLPGTLLVAGAVLLWAVFVPDDQAWTFAALALGVLALGTAVKYVVPHGRLRNAGVPNSTVLLGGVLGIVGFFVVPVVGLVLGFVLGVYLAETLRLGSEAAWPATKAAVRAVGLSLLIELAAASVAAALWLGGALAT